MINNNARNIFNKFGEPYLVRDQESLEHMIEMFRSNPEDFIRQYKDFIKTFCAHKYRLELVKFNGQDSIVFGPMKDHRVYLWAQRTKDDKGQEILDFDRAIAVMIKYSLIDKGGKTDLLSEPLAIVIGNKFQGFLPYRFREREIQDTDSNSLIGFYKESGHHVFDVYDPPNCPNDLRNYFGQMSDLGKKGYGLSIDSNMLRQMVEMAKGVRGPEQCPRTQAQSLSGGPR
jgi:hypothetical protein